MNSFTDFKKELSMLYIKIINNKIPDISSFDKLIKLSSYCIDGDNYIKDCVLYFLSIGYNNILSYIGIKSEILKKGHQFWFHNKGDKISKMNSVCYLLENDFNNYDNRDLKLFVVREKDDPLIGIRCKELIKRFSITSENIGREGELRFEELLKNNVSRNNIEEKINDKLKNGGDNKRKIYLNRRLLYDDGQNVHNSNINESVKDIIVNLNKKYGELLKNNKIKYLNELSKFIYSTSKEYNPIINTKIKGSFDRILSDTSKFSDDQLSMLEIAIILWIKINIDTENTTELKKRLIEELIEMNSLCATGHISRLINVLSGFYEEYSIKADYKDQIKIYVTNHYNKLLNESPDIDILIDEITETDINNKKNIIKFINDNGIRNKLYKEYKNVSLEKFNKWYDEAKNGYMGIF